MENKKIGAYWYNKVKASKEVRDKAIIDMILNGKDDRIFIITDNETIALNITRTPIKEGDKIKSWN